MRCSKIKPNIVNKKENKITQISFKPFMENGMLNKLELIQHTILFYIITLKYSKSII